MLFRLRTSKASLGLGGIVFALALTMVPWNSTSADWYDEWFDSGDSNYAVRIEEDWSLTISKPDPDRGSPQVATQMIRAPYASRFCNLTLNSCDVPTYSQGGLQLLTWRGQTNISMLASANRNVLRTENELITWTQYLRRDGGNIKFGISAAASTTWGDFSGVEISVNGAYKYLDHYDPEYSQQHSGVTYGANRVQSMVLVGIRKILLDGTVISDNTPRVIFSSTLDPALNPDNPDNPTGTN